jgi:hypothetical protein
MKNYKNQEQKSNPAPSSPPSRYTNDPNGKQSVRL